MLALASLCSIGLSSCTSEKREEHIPKVPPKVVPVSVERAQQLQVKTAAVEQSQRPNNLRVTGRIQADTTKEIDLGPRFTGHVVAILVKLGDHVKAGQQLAKVDSQEASELQAELIEAQSKVQIAKAHEQREQEIYQEHLQRPKELLSAQTDHQQLKLQVQLAEAEFKRADDLHREKIASARDYQVARAKLADLEVQLHEAEVMLQREQVLYKNQAVMMRDVQFAHAETTRARQHVDTLKQRLVLLGMQPSMVAQVIATGHIVPAIPIVSPIDGVVTDEKAAVGEVVSAEHKIMTVTDLSQVVMCADVPEVDIGQVRLGAPVDIKIEAFSKETFHGTISFVSHTVNPTSRTVAIRASLPNPHLRLKTNMAAHITLREVPSAPRNESGEPSARQ